MATMLLEGLLPAVTEGGPGDRIDGLTRFVTGRLDAAAAAVTRVDPETQRHVVLSSSGYDDRTLDYLLTDFVRRDPGMAVVQSHPERVLTWRDVESYRSSYTVRSVLAPAGFDEGSSVALVAGTGEVVGAIHVSVRQSVFPDWLRALLAEVRGLTGGLVDQIMEQQRIALTPRELDVLALVADGMSNADIAQLLFISRSTVNRHVEHILDKLGTSSRVSAAVRATQLGLI
ncbi:helix-turn-helix transcriptional regulator [Gordonia paraffinivorans]|uniref:helix-turn-helix transcriptional regulator n=1 Tax=Gordonia paraffinivorans TaxID=175628 RepID=UPI0014485128|nr:LuxR C-terminal-related transcriptional regulator [Gordonia paraffinivorans]